MLETPFSGHVDAVGHLRLDYREAFDATMRALAGKRVVVTVAEDKARRSTRQLRWEFGVALPMIAESCGYDRSDIESLHYELLAIHYGREPNEVLGVSVPVVRRSRSLDTAQYAEHQEWIVRWAAETLGIVVPLPNEPSLDGEVFA